MSKAQLLIENILSLPEEATSPNAEERKADMLNQISALRAGMDAATASDFDEFVHYSANQRYLANGTTDEILAKMHPRELQLVTQKFGKPGHAPDATPGA